MELRITDSLPLANADTQNQASAKQAGVSDVANDVEQAIQQASSLSGDASVFSNSFGSVGSTLSNQPVATAATLGAVRSFADHNTSNLAADTVSDIFSEKFLKWGLRDSVARTFDTMFHKDTNHKVKNVLQENRPFTYSGMLGIDTTAPQQHSNRKVFSQIKQNVLDYKKHKRTSIKPSEFLKRTVVQNNIDPIKNMVDTSQSGIRKLSFGGLGQALGLGLMGVDVAINTKKTYDKSVENGDTAPETAVKTSSALVTKSAKSLISWEIAGAVFQNASHILKPLGTVGSVMGGIAAGALVASIFTKAANQVAPDA